MFQAVQLPVNQDWHDRDSACAGVSGLGRDGQERRVEGLVERLVDIPLQRALALFLLLGGFSAGLGRSSGAHGVACGDRC